MCDDGGMTKPLALLALSAHVALGTLAVAQGTPPDVVGGTGAIAPRTHDDHMRWWRDAKFGMFIHWGLYSIPAGEWPGKGKNHAEWIRDTAQIPVAEYETLLPKFNPVKFNADAWVQLARDAGMRYLVITSKHHDGFCLFDSALTEWDVMSTPFKRDIMAELADACRRTPGVRFCMYHSIMDWHHPDYLPRRPWERAQRPEAGADFERFMTYLKGQLAELCQPKYNPGVLWFDGEWEGTWTHERGTDLFNHMRKIAPGTIVNNRVDKGRADMEGVTKGPGFLGDYQTPEQQIPDRRIPGDWETCMTMNDHWGFNAFDQDFKSTQDLIRKLADIASKGGNFLLNVGPTAEGEIPPESVRVLREIGAWMKVNGDSIYASEASPFSAPFAWGRCTAGGLNKPGVPSIPRGATRLFLHVFDWPKDGTLVVPGIYNDAIDAYALAAPHVKLGVARHEDAIRISLPSAAPDPNNSVIALHIQGAPDIADPPTITAPAQSFVGTMLVEAKTARRGTDVRYTLDGSDPTPQSPVAGAPIELTQTTTLSARCFRVDRPVSPIARKTFTKATPRPAAMITRESRGLTAKFFKGEFNACTDFAGMKHAAMETKPAFTLDRPNEDLFAYRFAGYINVPRDGVYTFALASDDGSRLFIGNDLVVDNDGLHSMREKSAEIALAAGLHPISVEYFEKTGGAGLEVLWSGPGLKREVIPNSVLFQP